MRSHFILCVLDVWHSRPQRPRSFLVSTKNRDLWPGPTIFRFWMAVNTIDWHQNQSDLSDLNLSMRKVTGSPWIAELRYWTWPEVRSRLLLLTKRSAASGDENGRLSTCSWKVEFLHEVCQHIHNLLIKSCWISRSRVLWVALGFLILSVGWWLSDLIQANLLCCRIARLRKGLLKLGKSLAGLEFCETCYSTLRRRQISDKSYRFIRRSI